MEPKIPTKTGLDHVVDAASAVLQSLPYTGGVAKYLDEYYLGQQRRWLLELTNTLRVHSDALGDLNCDVERLGAMLNELLFHYLRTSSEAKREALRAVFLNYASGKPGEGHEVDAFMRMVADLSELHILILAHAYIPGGDDEPDKGESLLDLLPGVAKELAESAVDKLLTCRLIDNEAQIIYKYPPTDLRSLRLTGLGQRFTEWIRFAP